MLDTFLASEFTWNTTIFEVTMETKVVYVLVGFLSQLSGFQINKVKWVSSDIFAIWQK